MTLSKFLNLNKGIKIHNHFRDLKMEKYLKNGKEIYDTYCTSTEARPIMLPQAPQHKYIDVYPDESEPGPSFKDDKKHQLDYETEVVVYRVLEGLNEDINVLHSFEYTHRQFSLCDKSHVKKGCEACRKPNNREGECDFLIIGKKSVVIIEVKNMTSFSEAKQRDPGLDEQQHKSGLQKSYKISVKQRQRMVKLIKSIEECTKIFHFTACPNFTKGSSTELTLEPDQLSSVIFKEDIIEDFQSWWKSNITDVHKGEALMSDFQAKHEKVRTMLLAIWCTDNKGHCDKSMCSLGWCIQDIDDKLRSGNFTFRKNNPNVNPAPYVIREYLGVNNLTKKQFEAFNSEEKLVFINGPAGTGKSVILIAKAIQRAKSNANRKILFFVEDTPAEEGVKTAFEKANVRHCTLYETEEMTTLQIIDMISDKLADNQVIIIHCPQYKMHGDKMEVLSTSEINQRYSKILTSHIDCDVFIDDMQSIPHFEDTEEKNHIMTTLCSLLEGNQSNGYIWIAHDNAQDELCTINPPDVQQSNSPFHTITLSKNLRNTYDISNSLSVIRDQIEEEIMREGSPDSNETIVKQTPGHYIRGPKINIYVFKRVDVDLIGTYLGKELDKLQQGNVLTQLNTAVIYRLTAGTTQKTLGEMIEIQLAKYRSEPVGNIPLLYTNNTSSGEWPAVIVIFGLRDLVYLPSLYLAMSRARVYCSVLLFSNNDITLEAMEQFLSSDFKHCANIKRHY